MEEDFYIVFRYGGVLDASDFLRSPRALWLQIKSDNVEETTKKILDFGARKLDLPSGLPESVPYLYFQAPGGTMLPAASKRRGPVLLQGPSDGQNIVKEKEAEALKEKALSNLAHKHDQKAWTAKV